MKKIFILIILISFSFSKSIFWSKVDYIENKYYNIELKNDDINKLIDKKYRDFKSLINLLKDNPYDLVDSQFNIDDNEKIKLLQKIKINKKYNYNLAVTRDNLKLQNIKLKQNLYIYFITLANSWITYTPEELHKLNEEYLNFLSKIDYAKFYNQYKKIKAINGKVENQVKKEFIEFNRHYLFFIEILDYIDNNKKIFKYNSFLNFFKLDFLIETINSFEISKIFNTTLRFIHIDIARLILSIFVLLSSSFFTFIVYKRIYIFFKNKILITKDDIDDILLDNLNKIRKPISILVFLIGLKFAFNIIVYPENLSDNISNFFYIFYIINIIYLLFIFIDNIIVIYISNQKDNIRKELITLIISISKLIIILIGILLILVKYKIDISGILASLGIGGLAVALAAQNTLSNFFGLIKMIADKSFSIGDWIETKDIEGTVVNIGFISTKIRTFDNALITIPNSILANSSIKNWSQRKIGRRIKMYIGVTYNLNTNDLKKALKDIKNMLKNHPQIITSDKINYKEITKNYKKEQTLTSIEDKYGVKTTLLVYLDKFNDSSIDILIYTFSKTTNWEEWLQTKEDIMFKIIDILKKNNLEFAYPSQSIYIEKK